RRASHSPEAGAQWPDPAEPPWTAEVCRDRVQAWSITFESKGGLPGLRSGELWICFQGPGAVAECRAIVNNAMKVASNHRRSNENSVGQVCVGEICIAEAGPRK